MDARASVRWHAWLAACGIALFALLYAGLTAWMGGLTLANLGRGFILGRTDAFAALGMVMLAAPPAALLALLLNGLAHMRRPASEPDALEVTREHEPKLFAFLDELAEETRAPRPYRVFLCAGVNAGVSYHGLSGLILPGRKNLYIGLGLVNSLTQGELRAVLAHEFGHVGQSSMAIGRWVYMAERAAGYVVASRGGLDRFAHRLSGGWLGTAWIGWALRVAIWSIRAVLDTAYRAVLYARAGVDHEMEFEADRVAVRVAGSDQFVHGLYRLQAAEDAFDRALKAVVAGVAQGSPVADVFSVQSLMVEEIGRVLCDPLYGQVPPTPKQAPESHRLFPTSLGHPPRMWSTHPPNREREDRAKRNYVSMPPDPGDPWRLFAQPRSLRRHITQRVSRRFSGGPLPEPEPIGQTLARVKAEFGHRFLDPAYQGVYLGRCTTLPFKHARDTYSDEALDSSDACLHALEGLYPTILREQLSAWRELRLERDALRGLQLGALSAPGGVIRYRGREIGRTALPQVVGEAEQACRAAEQELVQHDQRCRGVHRHAARLLGSEWVRYLESVGQLLHYAEHEEHDVQDALDYLQHIFRIVTLDRHISAAESRRLLAAAYALHDALAAVFKHRHRVVLPEPVARRLGVLHWSRALPGDNLAMPTLPTLEMFLAACESFTAHVLHALTQLRGATLEELLCAEAHVADCVRRHAASERPPDPGAVPSQYPTRTNDEARPRQQKIDLWDRFQIAHGFVPGAARLVAAAAVLGGALFYPPREGALVWMTSMRKQLAALPPRPTARAAHDLANEERDSRDARWHSIEDLRSSLRTRAVWAAAERRFPNETEQALDAAWRGIQQGDTERDAEAGIEKAIGSLVHEAILVAQDEQLESYLALLRRHTSLIGERDPEACRLLTGESHNAGNQPRAIARSEPAAEFEEPFLLRLFASEPRVDRELARPAAARRALRRAARKLSRSEADVLRDPNNPSWPPRLVCDVVGAFYGAVAGLPPRDRALALRQMFQSPARQGEQEGVRTRPAPTRASRTGRVRRLGEIRTTDRLELLIDAPTVPRLREPALLAGDRPPEGWDQERSPKVTPVAPPAPDPVRPDIESFLRQPGP